MSPDQRHREGKPWLFEAGIEETVRRLRHHTYGTFLSGMDEHGLFDLVDGLIEAGRTGVTTQIEVELRSDGGCRVSDDGPGLSIEPYPGFVGRSTLEMVVSPFLSGYCTPAYAAPTIFSERLAVEVAREGFFWRQDFARGERTSDLRRGEPTEKTGTTITFWPDPTVFGAARFDAMAIRERLRELACLYPSFSMSWIDSRTQPPTAERFSFPDGLADYVRWLNRDRSESASPLLHFREAIEGGTLEVAAQWIDRDDAQVSSFANAYRTSEGGTHLNGFLAGVS